METFCSDETEVLLLLFHVFNMEMYGIVSFVHIYLYSIKHNTHTHRLVLVFDRQRKTIVVIP